MNQEEKQKRLIGLEKTVQNLKDNQKLIMGVLTSDTGNGLTDKDLKIVKWAYNRRFDMLQREKQILIKKN